MDKQDLAIIITIQTIILIPIIYDTIRYLIIDHYCRRYFDFIEHRLSAGCFSFVVLEVLMFLAWLLYKIIYTIL